MDSLNELTKTNSSSPGFFKHVFNFDDDSKGDMLNIVQYALLAIIPVVIINKLMNRFVPEADDQKGSLEIVAEVVAQVVFLFLAILIVHRIITYIPTYSGAKYVEFSVTNIILVMLFIVLSLQTKLGEKVSILVDRINELWEGPNNKKKTGKGNGNVKVSQPIVQGQATMQQALGTTSINTLPMSQPTQVQTQSDFNDMYRQDTTPLVGAATPGVSSESFMGMGGPVPANDGGFGGFGSAFW
jgi:hypothetical protein